jgi:hypothetical protein
MPFRSTPLFHYATTAVFAVALIAIAAIVGTGEFRLRKRQQSEELFREALMMAAVVEPLGALTSSTATFIVEFNSITRSLQHDVFIVMSTGATAGLRGYGDRCTADNPCGDPLASADPNSPVRRGFRNETGVLTTTNYAGMEVLSAYVPIKRLRAVLVVEREASIAYVGVISGVYAAAAIVCILAAYAVAWAAGESLAAKTGSLRVAGIVLLHVCQFLPLIGMLAVTYGASDAAPHASRHHLSLDAGTTLSVVSTAVERIASVVSGSAAMAAVDSLAALQNRGFSKTTHAGLYVEGLTSRTGAVLEAFDPTLIPFASFVDDIAVVTGIIGPERRRVVYGAQAITSDAARQAAVSVGCVSLSILGVLAAALLPRSALGGSVRSKAEQFPHFASARSPGPIASIGLVLVAALIPGTALLQHVAAAVDFAHNSALASAAALAICGETLHVTAWHAQLVAGAAFGSSAVTSLKVSAPPAAAAADLVAARDVYAAASTDRLELQDVIGSIRANKSTIFRGVPLADMVLDMTGPREEGYSVVSGLLASEVLLANELWTLNSASYAEGLAAVNREVAASLTALRAAGLDAAATATEAAMAKMTVDRASAVRGLNSLITTNSDAMRAAALHDIRPSVVAQGAASTAAWLDQARAAVKVASRCRDGVAKAVMESQSVEAVAAAGYVAITVTAAFATAVLALNLGRSPLPLLALPLAAAAVLCFLVKVGEQQAKLGIESWIGVAVSGAEAPWLAEYDRYAADAPCDAALMLGALLTNVSLPSTFTRWCSRAQRTPSRNAMIELSAISSYNHPATSEDVAARMSATDARANALLPLFATECPSARASDLRSQLESVFARVRTAPLRVEIASRSTPTDTIGAFWLEIETLGAAYTSAGCNATLTNLLTAFKFRATEELASAFGVIVQPSFATLKSIVIEQGPHLSNLTGARDHQDAYSEAQDGWYLESVAWSFIPAMWAVILVAIGVHKATYRAVLEAGNKDDLQPLDDFVEQVANPEIDEEDL